MDLNPIRAGMAAVPEQPDHTSTSIKERITQTLNLAESIASLIQTQQLNHFNFALEPLLQLRGQYHAQWATGHSLQSR